MRVAGEKDGTLVVIHVTPARVLPQRPNCLRYLGTSTKDKETSFHQPLLDRCLTIWASVTRSRAFSRDVKSANTKGEPDVHSASEFKMMLLSSLSRTRDHEKYGAYRYTPTSVATIGPRLRVLLSTIIACQHWLCPISPTAGLAWRFPEAKDVEETQHLRSSNREEKVCRLR